MARYKDYCYEQGKMIPISFRDQILPGTFEYTLSYVIDHEQDLSVFEQRYNNDDTGCPAYDPALLLKWGDVARNPRHHGRTTTKMIGQTRKILR